MKEVFLKYMLGNVNKAFKRVMQLKSKAGSTIGLGLVFMVLFVGLFFVTKANSHFFFNSTPIKQAEATVAIEATPKLDKSKINESSRAAIITCPTTPDVGLLESSIVVTQPSCPDTDIPVSFDINNEGNIGYSGDISITFYNGDPTEAGAIKLKTETIAVTDFNEGDQMSLSTVVIGSGAPFDLYISVNDDGLTAAPIVFPTTSLDECYYGNNLFSASINPEPFAITAVKIQDNSTCSVTAAGTGAARAYKLENGVEVVAGYTFNWYKDEILVSTGPTYTGMVNGEFKVIATNNIGQCFSDTATINIEPSASQPEVIIQQLRLFDDCGKPNGKSEVLVYDQNGVRQPVGKYTYEWYEGNGVFVTPIINVSHVVNALSPILYSVYVENKKTGCNNIATIIIEQDPDLIPIPEIVVDHIDDCTDPDGGLSATVDGTTQNIQFFWYIGRKVKPTADYTDPVVTGLPSGDYTLVVIGKNSCPSDPVIVTIEDRRRFPAVTALPTGDQTSCDAGSPTGSANASVDETAIGGSATETVGYTFEWYSGQGTSTPIIGTGPTIGSLAAGTYTVRATHNTEACESTAEVVIAENLVFPTVAATATDITQCSPPNGSVSANVGGATVGYSFYWFNGLVGTPDITNPDFIGASVTGVAAGSYTVVAVDDNTLCESATQVVTVNDLTGALSINLVSLSDQSSCATPNGSISVEVNGTTSGFTFRWFNGQNTLPVNEITPSPGATITGLAAGIYTVLVTNSATGCENTVEYTINEVLVYPNPSIVVTDQTNCDPANGSLSASVGGNTGNYTFYWFNGLVGGPDITNADYTGSSVTGLEAGDYTLAVVDNTTQCQTVAQTTIQDLTATPVISLVTQVDQTSCDPVSPNASISVAADGTTVGYTFRWFIGQNTLPANEITPPPGATVTGLAAGIYTVLVRNDATGCEAAAAYIISDAPVFPTANITVTDQSNCDPANGSLSADVGGTTTGYSFYWFNGTIGTPDISSADYSGPSVGGLLSGDYTLVVVDNATSCQSSPQPVTIQDITVLPVITLVSQSDQVSCDPGAPTGAISVEADGTTVGHTFRWFTGQNTLAANEILPAPGAAVTGLSAGIYTVLVRNDATGCEATAEYIISDAPVFPAGTITVTDQSNCDPANGSLSADVGGTTTGYSFYWFNGTIGTPDISSADYGGATIGGLSSGDYTLVVVDDATSCQSTPQPVTIQDITVLPVITLVSQSDQVSCDPGSPTGAISVEADGTTTGYIFRWFSGQNTLPANEILPAPGAVVTGLSSGIYTVLVRSNTTGCEATVEYIISDAPVFPSATITVTDQSNCDPTNGSLSANVGGITTGYSFYWFNGTIGTPDINNPDYTGAMVGGLSSGDYTLVIVDDATTCESSPQPITIQDITVLPVISLVSQVDQTSCDTASPNGELSVDADGTTVGYTFRWFVGQNTLAANEILPAPGATIAGLAAGIYTVLAHNDATGCESTAEYVISDALVFPTANIAVTDQSTCVPANGSLDADIGGATVGYSFFWFDGNIGTPDINNPDYTGVTVTGLASGDYTLVVVDDATSCASSPQFVTIQDITVPPVINILSQTDQSSCDIASPNGSISVDADGTTVGYTFRWFIGQGTTNEIIPSPGATITGLTQGIYTVLVRSDATGCESIEEITLGQNIVTPVLTATPVYPTTCSPLNGSITISVSTGVVADYTFFWYDGLSTKATPDYAETGNILSALAPGDYTVEAFNNLTNCSAAPVSVTLVDATPVVTITQTDIIKPADCNAAAGELEVLASAAGSPSFTYEWFEGRPPYINPSIGTTTRITGLLSGVYTVEVTNLTTGCVTDSTFNLPFDGAPEVDIDITNTINNTSCDVTNYNGEIAVQIDPTTLSLTDPGDDQNEYTLNLYVGPNPVGVPITAVSPAVFIGLAPGDYSIVALQNFAPNCPSTPVLVTIADDSIDPVLNLVQNDPNTNCAGVTPDGILEIEIDGGAAPVGYTIDWYEGTDNTAPALGTNFGVIAGANGERIEQLPSGNYHVEVVNNTSTCAISATYTVYDDPVIISIPVAQITLTPQDDCSPVNGSAAVNGILEDGVLVAIPSANYNLDWFDALLNPLAAPVINNQYTDLAAGTYYVQATNTLTGCSSSQVLFEISDQTVTPLVVISTNTPQ